LSSLLMSFATNLYSLFKSRRGILLCLYAIVYLSWSFGE